MTKTFSLKDVTTLVEKEATNPSLPGSHLVRLETKENAEQFVGGFSFTDTRYVDDKIEEAKQKRHDAIATFKTKCSEVRDELQKIDITPLAVVPAGYWDEIVKCHDLVTLRPTLDGNVYIRNDLSYSIGTNVNRVTSKVKFWTAMAFVVAVLFQMIMIFATIDPNTFPKFVVGTIDHTWYLIVALPASLLSIDFIGKKMINRKLREWLRTHSLAELLRSIVDSGKYYEIHPTQARLNLPTPPQDVIEILRKLDKAKKTFEVTAEAAAVKLTPSPEDCFMKGHGIMAQQIAEAARDPIITKRYGNVVAVLAQFGDFEWEQKIVNDVIWSKPLPI